MKPALVSAASTAADCSGVRRPLRPPGRSAPSPAAHRRWHRPAAPPAASRRSAASWSAIVRSSSARAGSLKSLVSWICAVTVAPARLSSDSTASRSAGSAVGRGDQHDVGVRQRAADRQRADRPGELLVRGDPVGQVAVRRRQLVLLAAERRRCRPPGSFNSGEEILVAPSTMPRASARNTAASETMWYRIEIIRRAP